MWSKHIFKHRRNDCDNLDYCMLPKKSTNNNSAQHLLLLPAQKPLCTKLIRVVYLAGHNTFVLCIDLGIEALCAQLFAHNSAHNVFTHAHNCAQGLHVHNSAHNAPQPCAHNPCAQQTRGCAQRIFFADIQ